MDVQNNENKLRVLPSKTGLLSYMFRFFLWLLTFFEIGFVYVSIVTINSLIKDHSGWSGLILLYPLSMLIVICFFSLIFIKSIDLEIEKSFIDQIKIDFIIKLQDILTFFFITLSVILFFGSFISGFIGDIMLKMNNGYMIGGIMDYVVYVQYGLPIILFVVLFVLNVRHIKKRNYYKVSSNF